MTRTIRLTAAQALVRYLSAQMNEDGHPFIAGCWAIFGHGNVAGLGEALYANSLVGGVLWRFARPLGWA